MDKGTIAMATLFHSIPSTCGTSASCSCFLPHEFPDSKLLFLLSFKFLSATAVSARQACPLHHLLHQVLISARINCALSSLAPNLPARPTLRHPPSAKISPIHLTSHTPFVYIFSSNFRYKHPPSRTHYTLRITQ